MDQSLRFGINLVNTVLRGFKTPLAPQFYCLFNYWDWKKISFVCFKFCNAYQSFMLIANPNSTGVVDIKTNMDIFTVVVLQTFVVIAVSPHRYEAPPRFAGNLRTEEHI